MVWLAFKGTGRCLISVVYQLLYGLSGAEKESEKSLTNFSHGMSSKRFMCMVTARPHNTVGEEGEEGQLQAQQTYEGSPLPAICRCVTLTSGIKQAALWRRNCYALN